MDARPPMMPLRVASWKFCGKIYRNKKRNKTHKTSFLSVSSAKGFASVRADFCSFVQFVISNLKLGNWKVLWLIVKQHGVLNIDQPLTLLEKALDANRTLKTSDVSGFFDRKRMTISGFVISTLIVKNGGTRIGIIVMACQDKSKSRQWSFYLVINF